MDLPDLVQSTLDGESVVARVSLGGEDELLVTATRTVVYRAEGLLSDESVVEYPHDAERVETSEGRRKSKVTLDYGLDGEETVVVPTGRLDDVLQPLLAGVLNATGVTGPGETVKQTFRFSELTVVVTSARLVKHVGSAVWGDDHEEYHYADVTDLTFEDGSVATSVVVTLGGRQERFKAPNEQARAVRETVTDALLAYYDADDLEAFREVAAPDADDDAPADDDAAFGEGPDPLRADPPAASGSVVSTADRESDAEGGTTAGTAEKSSGFGESGFESPGIETDESVESEGDVAAELAALREAVEAQNERLRRHEELVERLVEELRQGR